MKTSRSNNVVEISRKDLQEGLANTNLRLDAQVMRIRAIQDLGKQFQSEIQSITTFPAENAEKFAEGVIKLMDGREYRLSLKLEEPKPSWKCHEPGCDRDTNGADIFCRDHDGLDQQT